MITIERKIANELRTISRTHPDEAARLVVYFNQLLEYVSMREIEADEITHELIKKEMNCRMHSEQLKRIFVKLNKIANEPR